MSDTQEIIKLADQVKKEAEAQASGDPGANERLRASVHKLQVASESPQQLLTRIRFQPVQSMCLLFCQEIGVLRMLAEAKGQPIKLKRLSEQSKYDELLIMRHLRILTSIGVCDEAGEQVYKANKSTEFIASPQSEGTTKHVTELLGPIAAKMVSYARETGFDQFAEENGRQSVFEYSWGTDLWGKLRADPEHKKAFDNHMAGSRKGIKEQWYETFPAAERLRDGFRGGPDDVLLVDVAGNRGHDIYSFKTSQDLPGRFILEDLPETLTEIDPESIKGVELKEYNFFTPQPIQGARAYYFRRIFHDWSHQKCVEILKNTAASMEKGYSKVLIDDWILPVQDAPLRGASLDMLMMFFTCGMERTLPQWQRLLDDCGLRILKIWGPPEGGESIIEGELI